MNFRYQCFLICAALFGQFYVLPAQVGQALALDGCTNYFQVAESNLLDYDEVISLECWVRPNCADGNRVLLSKQWCNGEYGYYLSINDGHLYWSYSATGSCATPNTYTSVEPVVPAGTFTHVAVVHSSSDIKLFVDGNEVAGEQDLGTFTGIFNSSDLFRIGAYRNLNSTLGNHFSGLIDEIRVWNIALDETQIQQNMNVFLTGFEPGLALYYDMEQNGQGNNLVLVSQSFLGSFLTAIPSGETATTPYTITPAAYENQNIELDDDLSECVQTTTLSVPPGNYKEVQWSNGATGSSTTVSTPGSYSVIVETELCRFFYDTVQVAFQEVPLLFNEFSICENDTLIVNGTAYTQAGTYLQNLPTTGAGCDTLLEISLATIPAETSQIELSVCGNETIFYEGQELFPGSSTPFVYTNTAGCDSVVQVEVLEIPISSTEEALYACEGSSIDYLDTTLIVGSTTEFVFESFENCDSLVRILVLPISTATEDLVLSVCEGGELVYNDTTLLPNTTTEFVFESYLGCDSLVSIEVLSLPAPSSEELLYACENNEIAYQDTILSTGTTTQFTFERSDGCDSVVLVTIFPSLDTNNEFLGADTVVCGTRYLLSSPFPGTVWNGETASNSFEVTTSGEYEATYEDSLGCLRSDTIRVSFTEQDWYVPNVFSPNNDNLNDCFQPIFTNPSTVVSYRFSIYNRWGAMLYETTDPEACWDGTFRGKAATMGVFVWVMELEGGACGVRELTGGDVTLIR